jgi:hypothetical protein
MGLGRLLDQIPIWALFLLTVGVVFLAVEGGYRLGRYRRQRSDQEKDAPVGAMVAATLGLLAFMLAFTFQLAASRFDARRQVLLEEANAIGTAYLRAGLLSDPYRSEVRGLLREYVDVRLEAVQSGNVEHGISRSAELHRQLWPRAAAVAKQDDRSIVTGLFIQSLNDVIDLHSKRVLVGLRSRIPGTIWLALYCFAVIALAAIGYHEGLSGSRRSLAVLAIALTFSGVMLLIADLDRPQEGTLRVSQQSMIDLKNSLNTSNSEHDGSPP